MGSPDQLDLSLPVLSVCTHTHTHTLRGEEWERGEQEREKERESTLDLCGTDGIGIFPACDDKDHRLKID
jgi:hypothetical protein